MSTREENARDLMDQEEAKRRRLVEDEYLTARQLDDKYNPDGDGEHPDFPREDWRFEVAEENTISGYWDWVERQIEMATDE